ncbi:hypothetical protein KUTeg_012618 [Tegillarca granosa]|uniref:Tryptophan synthase beta chain-like PALP domain-containing protein n=1 Tax=Tegillarca granosa TaxID=220873 RepID=A0ABQ9F5A5_TEGGR|nr:hypothetical protein KUTeg_012618 [Tegillarca granosa]
MSKKLANPETPIHKWTLPGIPEGFSISIKRDDMTGSTLSGNKVRKLEFLLAEALDRGCKHVITCGGIQAETGESSLLIPVGGSDEIGLFGYINVFQEMITQGLLEDFDDIVFACGSGGTAEGLCIANYLTGQKLKVHGIIVSDDKKYFHDHVNSLLVKMNLNVSSPDILNLIEGYKGTGYDFIIKIASMTGIMLDPVYTGKAARGLVHELNNNPHLFKGRRILFLHTGGIFGLYDNRINSTLKLQNEQDNMIQMWESIDDYPS